MKRILAIMALVLAAPVAAETSSSIEETLAACIFEQDQELLVEIRDAESEKAFFDAFRRGADLCDMEEIKSFSMGKFFDASAELIGKPTPNDAEVTADGGETEPPEDADIMEAAE